MSLFRSRPSKSADSDQPASAADGNGSASNGEGEAVNILRFLQPQCIELDLVTQPSEPREDETESQTERRLLDDKERLLQELVDLLDRSGEIVNPTKFYKDMVNRERKATTAIAPGLAIPHVRSKQVRNFIMGFARAPEPGFPFNSLDGSPTRLFFLLASPSFDDDGSQDRLYLRVYRQFAEMIQQEWVVDSFLDAESDQDVLNILRGYITQ
jgi:mannitol/fructose-specific phosphotransferase system IIA component (Ntr-type)